MKIKSVSRLLLALLWLGVVSSAQAMDDDTARRLADIEQQMGAINQRLEAQQPQASVLLNLQAQIDALKAQVSDLHGQLDVQAHNLETTQKRQTDLYQDTDARLRALTQNNASDAATAPTSGATAASPVVTNNAVNSNAEAQAYQAALSLFKQGNYTSASSSFKKFIKTYPGSSLVPGAQYWIGNAYFSTGDFKNALLTQQKLIKTYPSSPKVPDALLNMSSAQVELGDVAGARQTLQTLVSRYATTAAAGIAKKRLELLP